MKSITACPHCSTQFLVEDEQLSLYNGKVRCGNCLNVFNAVDYMVPSVPQTTAEAEENLIAEVTDPAVQEQAITDNFKEDSIVDDFEIESTPNEVESSASDLQVGADDQFETDDTIVVESNSYPETLIDDDAIDHAQLEQAYIKKTQSLIQNIDMHNISTEANTKAEPNLTENTTSEESFDQDELTYLPNLPSREELTEVDKEKQDSTDDYSVYDLPIEPSFTVDIDDEHNSGEPYFTNNFLETEAQQQQSIQQINIEQVNDQASQEDAFYLKEKNETSPVLIGLSALFILVLIGQIVYFSRNHIAMQYSSAKPYLQQACQLFACTIELPKEIQLFSIDDSGIQEDAEYQGVIRLSSTLTNRADFNQAYPNLEVTLTDTQDQPKIRRIFKPEEYLSREMNLDTGIAPGDAISIDMPLMTDDVKVSGFRILLTY
jgi:predicted Zn finger-like uncharacterized protein